MKSNSPNQIPQVKHYLFEPNAQIRCLQIVIFQIPQVKHYLFEPNAQTCCAKWGGKEKAVGMELKDASGRFTVVMRCHMAQDAAIVMFRSSKTGPQM
jgi:hypothetical protein